MHVSVKQLTTVEYLTLLDTLKRGSHRARRLRNFIDDMRVTEETNRRWEEASDLSEECSNALYWVCELELRPSTADPIRVKTTCDNCLDPRHGVHAIDCPRNPRYDG